MSYFDKHDTFLTLRCAVLVARRRAQATGVRHKVSIVLEQGVSVFAVAPIAGEPCS